MTQEHAADSQGPPAISATNRRAALPGIACGAGAALFWAIGMVAARHGISAGFSPPDIVLHRFVWVGLAALPFVARDSLISFGGIGLRKSVLLTIVGGPPLAHLSYAGFLAVPLAHGAVIQPSCAAIGGLILAAYVLKEKVPARRATGAAIIVAGLGVIGGEAFTTVGAHGLLGDLAFATAGLLFATFAMLLRRWHVAPMRAVAVTSVVALIDVLLHWLIFGFAHAMALGLLENIIQAVAQGFFAGAGATYLFTRSVALLGAGRAALFTSLVPVFTLLIGFALIGEAPSVAQLFGLAIVLIGFRLTQKE